ncbi:hypothetical protein Tco_1032253 [Tanacetum coccineum]|uniref:Uncharacterized protein n=1 Tax=Tanacetum coccineum TaxID=301880 RepID=A0ABQ5GDN0_9ASTR
MLAIQAEEGKGSGHPSEPQPPPSTAQPIHEEPIPNVVSSSHQKTQTPRQALNQVTELPQTSEPIPNVADEAVYEEWDDRVERATTTAASLDAAQASGNITKTQSTAIPNVPLPQGIGAGGSPRCQEATGGSIAQTSKVESLEADLKQTKQVYGAAYTKLIMKVKKLEKTVKTSQARRRAKIVVSDDEEDLEDSSKQGRMIEEIDQDAGVHFVSTGSGGVSTASRLFSTTEESVSTASALMPVRTTGMVQEVNISIPSSVVIKDKGKGIMEESEEEQSKRIKLQQEQERLGHEAAVRLQRELDEEEIQRMARILLIRERDILLHRKLKQKREKAMTQAKTENYTDELHKPMEVKELFETTNGVCQLFCTTETEDRGRASELAAGSSQATITDCAEVRRSKRGVEVGLDHEGSKKQKTNEASELVKYPIIDWEVYSEDTRRDDLVKLCDLVKERFSTTKPTDDKEKELWVELKRLFELDSDDTL